jgi:glutathione S-transferase
MALRVAGGGPGLVLYGFRFSHPCVSVQLMLEHKRLPYHYKEVAPGLHPFLLAATGFRGRTVPALRIGSARVQGSRAIAAELDRRFPESPPLFPAETEARRLVEEAEQRGEELQNAARRIAYFHLRRAPDMLAGQLRPGREGTFRARLAARALVAVASKAHGASDERALADLEELPERLAEIEGWLRTGVVGEVERNAADFQIAPSLRMLPLFPEVAAKIEPGPLADYAHVVVPEYPPLAPT